MAKEMQVRRAQGLFSVVVVLSEISHLFCCVLPTVFSIATVLVGMGLIGVMPMWLEGFHDVLHRWEIPLMSASALVLVIGWALHCYSRKVDCHDTGCGHGPCDKKKNRAARILQIATVLFLGNITVFFAVHYGAHPQETHAEHSDHDHAH